ncbi:hypothetical protein BRD12_04610 [Halobacteriales archaeon SW_12_67_38]|nr:MAG: hypothetical protein BRD12_04610 [Halobacteriales archaeon SW_12_67_38]
MYTGKTEQPCCLCGDPDTATRLDLPPRAVRSMKNAGSIAWRDIVGEVSIHFCESDWALVFEDDDLSEERDLVEARIRLWVLEDASASVEATGT